MDSTVMQEIYANCVLLELILLKIIALALLAVMEPIPLKELLNAVDVQQKESSVVIQQQGLQFYGQC